MGYVIPADFSRVSLEYKPVSSIGSRPSFGFGVAGGPSDPLADAVLLSHLDNVLPRIGDNYVLERVVVRNDVEVVERLTNQVGLVTSPVAPPSVSALVRLATGLAGRANRGRVFLPGWLTEASLDDTGTIESGTLTDIQTAWDAFIADIDTGGLHPLVILHSTSSDPTPVTAAVVQGIAATQRRRLRR